MGTWGTTIFSDDLACDVKEYYQNCLREQMNSIKAENAVKEYFGEELQYSDDGTVVILALAATAWQAGRLSENLKNEAINIIDREYGLERWVEAGDLLLKERKAVLKKLKKKLLSEQPPEKTFRKRTTYICPWKVGDVFAYQLHGKSAASNNMSDTWVVIQKVNQADNLMDGLSPVVTVRLTNSKECPNIDSLNLQCVRICRYLGYKWSYRLHILLNSNKAAFCKSLVYLGNASLSLPKDDYPHDNNKGYKQTAAKFFEETVIRSYLNYGLSDHLK